MLFETVLGNKEFEFVVSEVTLTVVTRHSTSGRHGVYQGQWLVLSSLHVVVIALFTMDNG